MELTEEQLNNLSNRLADLWRVRFLELLGQDPHVLHGEGHTINSKPVMSDKELERLFSEVKS